MNNRRTQSALLVAGAAAAAVAATLLTKRRLRAVPAYEGPVGNDRSRQLVDEGRDEVGPESSPLIEPPSAELPIGISADPDIEDTLTHESLPQDGTSGGALLGERETRAERDASDASLDDVWSSMPGLVGGEQSEGYDAVQPEDLGAVWLERATQTTHEERPHASDPNEVPNIDALVMSEASLRSALAPDDDEITNDELDLGFDDEEDEEEDEEEDDDGQGDADADGEADVVDGEPSRRANG